MTASASGARRIRRLTICLGVLVLAGTLGYRLSVFRAQQQAVDAIHALGGSVFYGDEESLPADTSPSLWKLIQRFVGWRVPTNAGLSGKHIDDAVLEKHVLPLRTLKGLTLTDVSISDATLARLTSFQRLNFFVCTRDRRNQLVFQRLFDPVIFEFSDVPPQDAAEYLTAFCNIPFELDPATAPSMASMGLTYAVTNKPARVVLDELFHSHQLEWLVRDGKIIITTEAAAAPKRQAARQLQRAFPNAERIFIDAH